MKAWFSQLEQREQLSLLVLGFALGLYVVYMLVWSPLDRQRDQMKKLGKHKAGVACLYLKKLADVDMVVLERLIRASVKEVRKRAARHPNR